MCSSDLALIAKVRVLDPAFAPAGWNRTPRGWTRIDLDPLGISRVMTFDFDGPCADRSRPVTLDELQDTFERLAGMRVAMADPRFLARFSDFGRLAAEYRRGRLLLAGDAAHVHFPIGGQGLNLGIQDAVNLGWKLAAVVHGGDDALLDSYESERRPAAQAVLENTTAQAVLMRSAPGSRSVVTELLGIDAVGERLGDMIGGRDARYPQAGVTSGGFQANLRLFTDRGVTSIAQLLYAARPVLIALDGADPEAQAAAAPWAGRITSVTARAEFPVAWRAALVRPDGYLAWTADESSPAGLARTLRSWFGDDPSER